MPVSTNTLDTSQQSNNTRVSTAQINYPISSRQDLFGDKIAWSDEINASSQQSGQPKPNTTGKATDANNKSTSIGSNITAPIAQKMDMTTVMNNLLSQSTFLFIVWFLIIYFIIYSIIHIFYKDTVSDVQTFELNYSRTIDFTILILFLIYFTTSYFSLSREEKTNIISFILEWCKATLNDPISIVTFSVILILFYFIIYILRIPMAGNLKPLTIGLVETFLWLFLVCEIIVFVFQTILKIPILDVFTNYFNNLWNNLPYTGPKIKNPYHGIFIDNGGDFAINLPEEPTCPTSIGSGSGNVISVGSGSGVNIEEAQPDEVFNVGTNTYTFDDAQAVCKSLNATLATYSQIEQSYNDGGEWCNYGWSENQMALFPTQKATWDQLQKTTTHKNDCGRPGVNGGYMANPKLKFGVNCYGKKPKPSENDLSLLKLKHTAVDAVHPLSETDIAFQKKVDYWKNNINNLQLNSFNTKKWSEY